MSRLVTKPRSFVFHDPSGKRWARLRRLTQTAGLAAALLTALLVLVALSAPHLPALGLPSVAAVVGTSELRGIVRGERLEKNIPYRDPKHPKIQYVRSASPVIHPRPAAQAVAGAPLVWGFFVNWDPGSIVSLRLHLSRLTHLVPEWLTLQNARGDIEDQSDQTVIEIARQANLPILALLTNFRDGWQPGDVRRVINDPDLRRDLIGNIRSNLAEHKFAGVNIDFEDMSRRDREPLV
ncbi:MAG: hypothetical protein ABUS49_08620, partial [Acidobacteriota bacterium]